MINTHLGQHGKAVPGRAGGTPEPLQHPSQLLGQLGIHHRLLRRILRELRLVDPQLGGQRGHRCLQAARDGVRGRAVDGSGARVRRPLDDDVRFVLGIQDRVQSLCDRHVSE